MNSRSTSLEQYEAGRDLLTKGDYDTAIELLSASASRTPHHKTYELLGEAYVKKAQYSDAILYFSAATTLNRGVRAPSLLAEVFLLLGSGAGARQFAELALSRDPSNKKALTVLAATQTA